jgi:hypothetical protein
MAAASQQEKEFVTKLVWRVMRDRQGWTSQQVGVTHIRATKAGFSARVTLERVQTDGRVAERRYRATVTRDTGRVRLTAIDDAHWRAAA